MRNRAVILRGVPGVGKTSVALGLRERLSPAIRLSIDTIRYFATPRQLTDAQLLAAKRGAAHLAVEYARIGMLPIIDSVFEDRLVLGETVGIIERAGVKVDVYTLTAPTAVILERNEHRDWSIRQNADRIMDLAGRWRPDVGRAIHTDGTVVEEVVDAIVEDMKGRSRIVAGPATWSTDAKAVLWVRHGLAVGPPEPVYPRDDQIAMTEQGINQVLALRREISLYRPTSLISSPSARAIQTAELLASPLGIEVRQDWRLRGRRMTSLEGSTLTDLRSRLGDDFVSLLVSRGEEIAADGEETVGEAQARVTESVAEAVRAAPPGGRIVLISHEGPHNWACAAYVGASLSAFRDFALDHGRMSLMLFGETNEFVTILAMNTQHLPAGLVPAGGI